MFFLILISFYTSYLFSSNQKDRISLRKEKKIVESLLISINGVSVINSFNRKKNDS